MHPTSSILYVIISALHWIHTTAKVRKTAVSVRSDPCRQLRSCPRVDRNRNKFYSCAPSSSSSVKPDSGRHIARASSSGSVGALATPVIGLVMVTPSRPPDTVRLPSLLAIFFEEPGVCCGMLCRKGKRLLSVRAQWDGPITER